MSTDYDDILQMLDDLEKRESKLTEWESGFVESCAERAAKSVLSPAQCARIEAIWDRVTG